MVPIHYPNQCRLIISEVFWQSPEDNFTGNALDIHPWYVFENYKFIIITASFRGQWVWCHATLPTYITHCKSTWRPANPPSALHWHRLPHQCGRQIFFTAISADRIFKAPSYLFKHICVQMMNMCCWKQFLTSSANCKLINRLLLFLPLFLPVRLNTNGLIELVPNSQSRSLCSVWKKQAQGEDAPKACIQEIISHLIKSNEIL